MDLKKEPMLEDDSKEKVLLLVEHRLPWLLVGLIGGIITALIASQFEDVLSNNINLTFFIPVIVYMASAVGSQTETIYIRNLGKKSISFWKYLFKETMLGIVLGIFFGLILATVSYMWLQSLDTSITVGLAVLTSVITAPIVALCVSGLLHKEGKDPAVGAGPFMTIIQDMVTLMLYFAIASLIFVY